MNDAKNKAARSVTGARAQELELARGEMRGDARRRQYRREAGSGEKWRTSGAKRKRDPGGPRELAAALAERPGGYDARERSIRAVRARIGWIRASRLHGQYLNVRTLILSGNRISELAWVRHFSQLQVLSLEANCVQDTRELRYLRHIPSLQRIRLEENPVVRSPFYAAHVKVSAKNLIELDCAPALDEATARKEVHLDLSLQSSLVEDFCELITLEQAEKLCRVHAELAMCTVRYPSWSTERERKRLLRLKHGWQFRELACETVADGTVEHLTSGNLGIFLRVCRYQDRLDAHAISDLQAEIAQWAVHSTPAKMSRRCSRSSSRRTETRWEIHAYNAVASDLREAIARVVLTMDRGRELDQEWLDTRPRLGPATATRHAAELEAERALLRRAELERAHHDVAWIRETMKKRATPRPPPPSIRTRPETPPYCRSPMPSPAMSAGASIASWRSADKSHFDELESCSESLYLASEHLLQATPRALEQL